MMTYLFYYFVLSMVLMALAALCFAVEDMLSYVKKRNQKLGYNYGRGLPFTLFMIIILLPFLNIFGIWFWSGVLKLMIKDKIEDYKGRVKV